MNSIRKQLDITPQIEYFPQYDPELEGTPIQAITYDGVDLKGEKTKVFAYIAFPENCTFPVPAVVLVHGGGCHPDCAWMQEWISRGYAVIAPDTTGYFPAEKHTLYMDSNHGQWKREIPADIAAEGYVAAPNNSEMGDTELPVEERWMYHAVSQVILAHNILRADDRIDNGKIGISGISWGGVITSIAIGYDTRFAFAVPIYGSAYLSVGLSQTARTFYPKENECWWAERQYDNMNLPVMWLCWNSDMCFSVNSTSMSYERTVKNNPNTVLSMLHEMGHSHTAGFRCKESYWYAEHILSDKPIPHISAEVQNGVMTFSCSEWYERVRLFYITEELSYAKRDEANKTLYMEQEWKILEVDDKGQEVILPDDAVQYYLEFLLQDDIVVCSQFF